MSSKAKDAAREEPEVTQEESVPSDGRDVEGEAMMKKVSNPKLDDPGLAEDKTPQKSERSPERKS